jgi:hypothetical protein
MQSLIASPEGLDRETVEIVIASQIAVSRAAQQTYVLYHSPCKKIPEGAAPAACARRVRLRSVVPPAAGVVG